MGLFDFLKRKKKPQETVPEAEPEPLIDIGSAGMAEAEPPETRYTQEYRDFLAEREAAEAAEGSDGGEE